MRKLFFIPLVFLLSAGTVCLAQLPIKPARTISFTTDEGSYMNLDLSPDGKTLVFDLLGDLYTLPSTGGTATQLTRGLALNLRPAWSPDGKRVAYYSDFSGAYHLNVRDVKGNFHHVLGQNESELLWGNFKAVWDPSGHYVTVGDSTYGVAGGKIPRDSTRRILQFSRDGYFSYSVDSGQLYRYDHTTKTKKFLSSISKKQENGVLSPDERWWAFLLDSGRKQWLTIRDLATSTERVVITPMLSGLWFNAYYRQFCFSPDSKFIFISYAGKIHRISMAEQSDEVIPFVAHVKADLGPFNYNTFRVTHDPVLVKYTRSAHASPDGRQVVFSALNKLYIKNTSGDKPYPLVNQAMNQYQPVYSPDGQWIAYVSWSDTAGGSLWRVPAKGGTPEQLMNIPGQYQSPAWSPDGKVIAVIVGLSYLGGADALSVGQLLLLNVNSREFKIIDQKIPFFNQPCFTYDGQRIVYQPFAEWQLFAELKKDLHIPLIVSKDLAGNDEQVLAVGMQHSFLRQRSISPDGRFMVYSDAEDLYLVPTVKTAGPQILYDTLQQPVTIRFAAGVDPYWSKDNFLCWTYGNRFFQADPDQILLKAEKTMMYRDSVKEIVGRNFIGVDIVPQRVVDLSFKVPAAYAHGVIVLQDLRLITMEQEKVIEHGTIVIKNGRIAAIGSHGDIIIPPDAKVLNLPGMTVMPGIVDLHLHLRIPPDIFPQQSWVFLRSLSFGVTSVRDPSLHFGSFGYSELLRTGQMIGPRLYTVGYAVRDGAEGNMRLDNLFDAKAIVRKRALLGGTVVKQYELHSRQRRQWLLMACRAQGLNMTNEGLDNPILQIAMIKDGSTGVEHNPVWRDVYKDILFFIAASKTWLTPTLQVSNGTPEHGRMYFNYTYWRNWPKGIRRFIDNSNAWVVRAVVNQKAKDTLSPAFLTQARIDERIRQLGGRIGMGSHGNDIGIGPHNEIWALQMGGFSNLQALQAATIVGAEALGIQQDLGSIKVGKIADLLLLEKNPLENIHNTQEIKYVMKDGILYEAETMNTVWPEVKKCPEWRLLKDK